MKFSTVDRPAHFTFETMASVKRKAVTDERPVKKLKSASKTKTEQTAQPTPAPKNKRHEKRDGDHRKASTTTSLLQEEERLFPRGGASILTPLEQRQIKAQAEQDALLELETGREEHGNLFTDEPNKAAKRIKDAKSRKSQFDGNKPEKSDVKILGLGYKTLTVGSTVLGRVTAVTSREIALALPNNLTGFVPITAVSQVLNARIERVLEETNSDDLEAADEDIILQDLFSHGQWLRAVVTSNGSEPSESNGRTRRHIELSIDPSLANQGLDITNAVPNTMVQASVRSVEDHGVILDLGLVDDSVKGFVSKKELGNAYTLEAMQPGQVVLGLMTNKASSGRVLNLSLSQTRTSAIHTEKPAVLTVAPTIDSYVAGTAVNLLVADSGPGGVVGKVMGLLDVTADVVHTGGHADADVISKRFKVGSKINARIIWTIPKDDGSRSVGVSFLEQTLSLVPEPTVLPANATSKLKELAKDLSQKLPLSAIIKEAKVTHVVPDRGLFLTITSDVGRPERGIRAFAHISQISDKKTDSLSTSSGPYVVDSIHSARIMSYDPVDNLYYVSLKQSILDQAFLRLEDVPIGATVSGTVEKLILGGVSGIVGILVKLSDNVTGLVPEVHFSDIQLQHPERKYRVGSAVTARVLSVDKDKRQLRLTLKRSLMEGSRDQTAWQSYKDLNPGMESQGTIIKMSPKGAVVQFFGDVRAWLPVSEIRNAYLQSPEEVFRLGQSVKVRIMSIDADARKMMVSAEEEVTLEPAQAETWELLQSGTLLSGIVSAKTQESISVDLDNGLIGNLKVSHLREGSGAKAENAATRLRIGQKLANLLVLRKDERSRTLVLSNKPDMIEAAKTGSLVRSLADVKSGEYVHGFIRNITAENVYVEFINETVGVISKRQIPPGSADLPNFGLRKDQSVKAWVSRVDEIKERFFLSLREKKGEQENITTPVTNPIDPTLRSLDELKIGKVIKARVKTAHARQINMQLADEIQGRIVAGEVFDDWDDIPEKLRPLEHFVNGQQIEVKILGIHQARTHRFLPISHRQATHDVFELSAKRSRIEHGDETMLSLSSVKLGSEYMVFISDHADTFVRVSLSPTVNGRIALLDLSDDVGFLQNLPKYFPIGRAMHATAKFIDIATNRLHLTARHDSQSAPMTLADLTPGSTVAARVTKTTPRSIVVQIADDIAGVVPLVEMSDDFDLADPNKYEKNEIVRVSVIATDLPNKKVFLSLRPSRILSSTLPVRDAFVGDASHLNVGELVRGFIKHVADKCIYVSLSGQVDARIMVSDISDDFVKDWQSLVEIDQLIEGRVLSIDPSNQDVRLGIKKSQVDPNYEAPLGIDDLEVGQTVTGKVRKVEDYGAFIDIDNTLPRLSGLCHRSEVADKLVVDVRKLYSEGDKVKAKVLKVDIAARKINLGLKAKYFQTSAEDDDSDDELNGVALDPEDEDEDEVMDRESDSDEVHDMDLGADETRDDDSMATDEEPTSIQGPGLRTSGFDWNADSIDDAEAGAMSEAEVEHAETKKRKRNKAEIKIDMTGDLDKYGPRNISDFERQLLGQPNNSGLWIQYMAFQLQLGEVQQARDVAERALRTIHIRETEEKANVWIARLNLEVEYGDEDHVEEVFKEACQMQDSLEMHEKLASIYIDSGKQGRADAVFERIVANKSFRASPAVWINYASFLMDKFQAPARGRALLPRALQSIAISEHRALTAKFAALEFKLAEGDAERGRTIFQGLMSEWPKWHGGWDMWTDLEHSRVAHAETPEAKQDAQDKVRALFERMAEQKMKKRRAKFLFKKWLEFEEQEGDAKQTARVKALAKDYVEKMQARADDEEADD